MGEMTDDFDAYPMDTRFDKSRPGVRISPTGRFIITPVPDTQVRREAGFVIDVDGHGPMGGLKNIAPGAYMYQVQDSVVYGIDPAGFKAEREGNWPSDGNETLQKYAEKDIALTVQSFAQMYGVTPTHWPPSIRDWYQAQVIRHEQQQLEKENKMRDPQYLREQAYKMLEEAALRESVPQDDPFEPGTVLKFEKRFVGPNGGPYAYAALKVDIDGSAVWFLTGFRQQGNSYDWPSLISFIGTKGLETVVVMTDGEKLLDLAKAKAVEGRDAEVAQEFDITLEDKVDKRPT
jgi:hypothetical protein